MDYPDRIEILKKCNEDNKIWNPNNQRWDLNEEEKAWTPYMFWEKAYDNIIRLESFYFRRNETAYNETENSLEKIIYDDYNATPINAAKAIIKPAMNQAFDQWESEFKDLKNCAHEYIEQGDYKWKKQSRKNIFFITLAVFISFVFIVYLILLLNRRRSDLNGILSRYWAF
uniref:Uncharacterized protein n=1 Tax=Panagrolaimus sp. ES5 TaxID=591445 RepID=A0AC34FS65_9BILA